MWEDLLCVCAVAKHRNLIFLVELHVHTFLLFPHKDRIFEAQVA